MTGHNNTASATTTPARGGGAAQPMQPTASGSPDGIPLRHGLAAVYVRDPEARARRLASRRSAAGMPPMTPEQQQTYDDWLRTQPFGGAA
ncbi:hypothetical protein GCM10009817_30850 [Terrabacter lapilli]|uniref:Uncharacterized protein n=1 Tax=Terrabacter lapilli TaxID=436231 RepID=A0ABN2SI76_9MICO